jgi:two-component system, chemotaxis family, chemotaxis protein CheY
MVVDDAMFMRKKCAQLLIAQGHQVVEAANGAEAIVKYKEARPDGVLMDITMPDIDGMEALKIMREYDPSARIAMCTAMGQQGIVIGALKARLMHRSKVDFPDPEGPMMTTTSPLLTCKVTPRKA